MKQSPMNQVIVIPLVACLWIASMRAETNQSASPEAAWQRVTLSEAGLDEARLAQARDYALTGVGSGCISSCPARTTSPGEAASSS